MTGDHRAEQADNDRLHGWELAAPWQCPHHLACHCPPPLPVEHCPAHGDYVPASLLDGDCPICDDLSRRIDAHHDHHHTLRYRPLDDR